jgi:hypothetical protein
LIRSFIARIFESYAILKKTESNERDLNTNKLKNLLLINKKRDGKSSALEKIIYISVHSKFSLNEETDRGCVLLTVSFLEQSIERYLFKKLIGSKNRKKFLFDLMILLEIFK